MPSITASDKARRLQAALISGDPEAVEICLPGLHRAICELRVLRDELAVHPLDPAKRQTLESLQTELPRIQKLLNLGSGVWTAGIRQLGLDQGYDPAGNPAAAAGPSRLSEHG